MDPASCRKVWDVIRRLKQNNAVLVTTNSLSEAEYLADTVGIMYQGEMKYKI